MKKEEIMFRIDQYKKDKMIYLLYSIAVSFVSEIFYFFYALISGKHSVFLAVICMIIPFMYLLYFVMINRSLSKKIDELEGKL